MDLFIAITMFVVVLHLFVFMFIFINVLRVTIYYGLIKPIIIELTKRM